MAEDRDSLLREVEEELRREQMQKIWERYNGLILGAAAAIVIGIGGFTYYKNARTEAAQLAGAEFSKAVALEGDEAKAAEALKAFEQVASSGAPGYATLASLHVAGAQAKAGNVADAVASYEAIAKDASADELLKNFATLQAASLRMADADFTEIKNRLTPLTRASSSFKTSASELLGLAAFKAGAFDEARSYLEPLLIDPAATQAIQDRVKIVLGTIAAGEIAKAGDVEGETAGPATGSPAGNAATDTPKDAAPDAASADKN
jgi:hypothetical protein